MSAWWKYHEMLWNLLGWICIVVVFFKKALHMLLQPGKWFSAAISPYKNKTWRRNWGTTFVVSLNLPMLHNYINSLCQLMS